LFPIRDTLDEIFLTAGFILRFVVRSPYRGLIISVLMRLGRDMGFGNALGGLDGYGGWDGVCGEE
jgi:hypothetical protein